MKKFSLFEAGIIGLFCGVVVSTYLVFITANNSFIGSILNWISLRPLLQQLHLPENYLLVGSFIFFILVYTLYGIIIGAIVQTTKTKVVIATVALTIIAGGFEQIAGSTHYQVDSGISVSSAQVASVIRALPQTPKQYFGNESHGDLNDDGRDDVAFIINRNDPDRGLLYYLTASLANDAGYSGTNLVFLGNNVRPIAITIASGTIMVSYTQTKASTTDTFFAHITKGSLEQIINASSTSK